MAVSNRSNKCLYKSTVIRIKYVNGQISEPITTNQGRRQGCGLSTTLFIYINRVIKEWKGGIRGINAFQLKMKYNKITSLCR
jgi:hypothetical protein